MCVALIALITSLRIFGDEKKVMKREFRAGVSPFQYFFTRMIVHIPRILLAVLLFLSVIYPSVCFRAPFVTYFIMYLMVYVWVTAQGLICSLVFTSGGNGAEATLLLSP